MESGTRLVIQLFFLIILVGINAFFASSEIALLSLNEHKLKKEAKEGKKQANLLWSLIKEPSKFLSTIQVGITLSGLLASAFAAETFAARLGEFLQSTGLKLNLNLLRTISLILVTIVLSYFTLVFGELVPKRLAMQKAEVIANFSVKPLLILLKILKPFVKLLTLSTNFFIRLFGVNPEVREKGVTEEEIRMMVDLGEEKGVIEEEEREMIANIFEFDHKQISEIMTHRSDIIGLPDHHSLEQLMETVIKERHTRFPVYKGNIDNIIGILHVKDLLPVLRRHPQDFKLSNYIRPPYNVPIHIKTDQIFAKLKKKKTHMAVVIDEFGGTAGIVTIEDLIEEIVGNIYDEYDHGKPEIEPVSENVYSIKGCINLDELEKFLSVDLPTENYDTLSGFIIEQLGRIPEKNEAPEIQFKNINFKVEKMNGRRISLVKLTKNTDALQEKTLL